MLKLIIAPDDIFTKKSDDVEEINDQIKDIMDQMLKIAKAEHAYGIAAPMVGVLKKIIVINQEEPIFMINPKIIHYSDDKDNMDEESISFPGVSVSINRSKNIKIEFLDHNGKTEILEAEGIFARCIQHEFDHLNAVTILSHVSRLKRDMLLNKIIKVKKHYKPHIHTDSCNH